MAGMMGTSLDDDSARYARVLYYGKQGSGKSTNIASMANRGLTVIVDIEDGYERDALEARGINTKNILRFKPRSYDEVEQVYWEIRGMIEGGTNVYGVGLDHWSELQDILVRDAAIQRIEKKMHELRKVAANDKDAAEELKALSVFKTDRPDYGQWTEEGKKLLRIYRDLPCHVAFASHETNDENTGKIIPLQTDKFRAKLTGGVRTVVYCRANQIKRTDEIEFMGITKPIDRFDACKDRTGKLPTALINPSMTRIIDILDGKLDIDKDEAQTKYLARKQAEAK